MCDLINLRETHNNLTVSFRLERGGQFESGFQNWLEQLRNQRRNRIIEFMGVKKCISEWQEELGFKSSTLRNRLTVRGWSIEKSLTEPVRYKTQQKAS